MIAPQILCTVDGSIAYIPVSPQLAKKLSRDWSDPVQIRIEGTQLVMRLVNPKLSVESPAKPSFVPKLVRRHD